MGGGAGPDLVRFDQIDFYAAVAAKRILPFEGEINEADYKFTAPDKYLKVDGKRYGIPFEISNYVLLYNKSIVKDGKAPANFDQFLETAKAATGNGVFGFAYRATMAERPGFWQDLCNFVFGFGGRWSDDAGNLTINSPKVVEGVAAYKKMYDLGATPKGTDAATYRRMFWENKLAMEVDNGGVAGIFYQQAPDLPLAAAPSPFPTRAQGLILAPLTVNANTKNKEAAFTFVKWALKPENQKDLQDLLGASNVATVVERSARGSRQAALAEGLRRADAEQRSPARRRPRNEDAGDAADHPRAGPQGAPGRRRSGEGDGRRPEDGPDARAPQKRARPASQTLTRSIPMAKSASETARLEGSPWTPYIYIAPIAV